VFATAAAFAGPHAFSMNREYFTHPFPFDPNYGYELEELLRVPAAPEPPDFEEFWRDTFSTAAMIQPEPVTKPTDIRIKGFDTQEIEFNSLGGLRIRGWLSLPHSAPIRRGLVVSHGYGGRDQPDLEPLFPDAAIIYPCARGLSLSRQPGVPSDPAGHVLHGIATRETYIHRGCVADIWAAASALLSSVESLDKHALAYVGGSFGGGIGALALPWDDRFSCAALAVPSFGQHPLRLQLPCLGSGESVRDYARTHPHVAETIAYFDASISARHLKFPVVVVAALFDPMVPPPGQFAIFNALAGSKELVVRRAAHFEHAGAVTEERETRGAMIRFLRAHP